MLVSNAISRALSLTRRRSFASSALYDVYLFEPPVSLSPPTNTHPNRIPNLEPKGLGARKQGLKRVFRYKDYKPPSLSVDTLNLTPPRASELPFDFRFSYTESDPKFKPIGLREPKYSPFGPGQLDRVWTGFCAPAIVPAVTSADQDPVDTEAILAEKRLRMWNQVQGAELTLEEKQALIGLCRKNKTVCQINLGRYGLTHNQLVEIHNCWKHVEAMRIRCLGVPTVDMNNVCTQLEDKAFGKIIYRKGSYVTLYRGRNYDPKNLPYLPYMLWKPRDPVYPRLINNPIDGLNKEESKEMKKKGLRVPILTKLVRNGYYGNLVRMVRDGFIASEVVRIDCTNLRESDYKKIGIKLRDLVPCKLVTFDKEQVVVWRGKNYKPPDSECFLIEFGSESPIDDDQVKDSRVKESITVTNANESGGY